MRMPRSYLRCGERQTHNSGQSPPTWDRCYNHCEKCSEDAHAHSHALKRRALCVHRRLGTVSHVEAY